MPLGMEENVTVDYNVLKVRGLGDFSGCKKALLPILLGTSDTSTSEEEDGPSMSPQQLLTQKLRPFHR